MTQSIVLRLLGSPPRVREKRQVTLLKAHQNRITPACAGKTLRRLLTLGHVQDHPRVCGKNLQKSLSVDIRLGSPPRVREKLTKPWKSVLLSRITPACAGKTER